MNSEQIESYKEDAANKYIAMVVYMMKKSDRQYSPSVTRAVMNLIESYESDSRDQEYIWNNYAELINMARLEEERIDMAPLMALKFMTNMMGQ